VLVITFVYMLAGAAACGDASSPSSMRSSAGDDVQTNTRPAAARPKPATIVAAGDISKDRMADQQLTARLVHSLRPTRVLALGDLQYPAGSYRDFLAYYDPTWGRFKDKTIPAPGNHEYETPGARGYLRYFGKRARPLGHTYFSRSVAGWHIVSLDSNIEHDARSPQLRWLRRDLAAARQDCVLALWHHPRFSSGVKHGGDPSVTPLWRALYRARADVVLNGHEHNYERFSKRRPSGRFARHGIREFVVGTGGAGHYPFGRPVRNSVRRITNVFGALEITLRPHAYGWRFVTPGGIVRDRGRSGCN
jgi:hypothetical protein